MNNVLISSRTIIQEIYAYLPSSVIVCQGLGSNMGSEEYLLDLPYMLSATLQLTHCF